MVGARSDSTAGDGAMSYRCSSASKTISWARANTTDASGEFRVEAPRIAGGYSMPFATRPFSLAYRQSMTSIAATTKASPIFTSIKSADGAGRPRADS